MTDYTQHNDVQTAPTYECGHLKDFTNSVLHQGRWSCQKCVRDCHRQSVSFNRGGNLRPGPTLVVHDGEHDETIEPNPA